MPNGVEFEGRYIHVGTFPIGIDPDKFTENLAESKVQNRISQLKNRFGDCKLIVGVDRLDYIKGVPQKMHAMEVFLSQHPEWVGKVVLVQLAIPSREDVEEYQHLRSTINELVGRINGQYGRLIICISSLIQGTDALALQEPSSSCLSISCIGPFLLTN